jgi:hypothetical protein
LFDIVADDTPDKFEKQLCGNEECVFKKCCEKYKKKHKYCKKCPKK